jgi:hypothetical protein
MGMRFCVKIQSHTSDFILWLTVFAMANLWACSDDSSATVLASTNVGGREGAAEVVWAGRVFRGAEKKDETTT